MRPKTLGQVVREARQARELSQRDLAKLLRIEPSHVAYIESGQRNPSLGVLRRIADTLGLNREEIFFLSHPDAKFLLGEPSGSKKKKELNSWQQFVSNRALLRRHKVTPRELKVLREISTLEDVASPRNYLFILNAIRQAGSRENL
jgi:transcriptional regulator with XRE-family HTH domain